MIEPRNVPVSTTAVPLVTVPAGPCMVTISPVGGTIYVGSGSAVTTSTGGPLSAPVTFTGYSTSSSTTLYAIASSGTVTTGIFISTAS